MYDSLWKNTKMPQTAETVNRSEKTLKSCTFVCFSRNVQHFHSVLIAKEIADFFTPETLFD